METFAHTPEAIAGFLVLGFAIRVTLRLVYGLRGPLRGDAVHLMMNVSSWILIGLATIALGILTTTWLSIFVFCVAGGTWMMAIVQQRRMRQQTLLAMLAASIERGIPISTTMSAFADHQQDARGHSALHLARLLADGTALPDAIDRNSNSLPEMAPCFAQLGVQMGDLGPALREALATELNLQSTWLTISGQVVYALSVLVTGFAVSSFTLIKVVPQFEAIFSDFEMVLPTLTRWVIAASHWAVPLILIPGCLLGGALLVYTWLNSIGLLKGPSWLDGLMIRSHSAVVLKALALFAERNLPFEPAIRTLSDRYPRKHIRRRMWRVADDVKLGGSWSESLRAVRLIGSADLALLNSAERLGNLPWALRSVADRGLRRLAVRCQSLVQLVFPIFVFAVGMLVLVYVVAMFMPLVDLIMGLT